MASESRRLRGWTLGGSLLLLAALLLCPSSHGETVPAGLWKSRPGDDPRWALPRVDDSSWRAVALPATWREQGYAGLDGRVWFRRVVPLGEEARLAARQGRLGLLLGPSLYGGYQGFARGRPLGPAPGRAPGRPPPLPQGLSLSPPGGGGEGGA